MTARVVFRALGWVVAEFIPWQALRAVMDRDYTHRVTQAAAAHDAVEGLNEYEAEHDGLDPAVGTGCMWCGANGCPSCRPRSQCTGCGDSWTDDHVCGRGIDLTDAEYDEFIAAARGYDSPVASAGSGASGEGVCGFPQSPPSPPPIPSPTVASGVSVVGGEGPGLGLRHSSAARPGHPPPHRSTAPKGTP